MKDASRVKLMLQIALFTAAGFVPVAWSAEDATLSKAPALYSPGADFLAQPLRAFGGDIAEIDVQSVGTSLQYIGVVLNGDGVNPNLAHPFLKVQSNTGVAGFDNAACYLGNNGNAGQFGSGFFSLTQGFSSAHMKAERIGNTVTLSFTNVDGGTKADQVYVCDNAPPRLGGHIGINGFNNIATADNFSDGNAVLDDFSYVGSLGSSGVWFDAKPGMNANGSVARGGSTALSFFVRFAEGPTHSDFDGDGNADLLWRNSLTGTTFIWLMAGSTQLAAQQIGVIPLVWVIARVEDYNGDGKSDIFWRNTSTGANIVWLMDGVTITAQSVISVPPAWKLQP